MAYDSTPATWLGLGYSLSASALSLPTATHGGTTIGTFTVDAATDILTTSIAHKLAVGDIVRGSTTTTLPAGLAAATDYYVLTVPSTTTLTLAATLGGATLNMTDAGTGTHTLKIMGVLRELTDTEAHATTGDIRKIMWAIADALYRRGLTIASADRPRNMTLSKSAFVNAETGAITALYSFQFILAPTGLEVAAE